MKNWRDILDDKIEIEIVEGLTGKELYEDGRGRRKKEEEKRERERKKKGGSLR